MKDVPEDSPSYYLISFTGPQADNKPQVNYPYNYQVQQTKFTESGSNTNTVITRNRAVAERYNTIGPWAVNYQQDDGSIIPFWELPKDVQQMHMKRWQEQQKDGPNSRQYILEGVLQ